MITNKIKCRIIILLLIGCPLVKSYAQKYPLAKMNVDLIKQQVFSPSVNQSMYGKTMVIGAQKYSGGISVHAPSSGFVYLGKKGLRFVADVGVDDLQNSNLSASNIESIARTDGTKTFYQIDKNSNKKILVGIGTSLGKIAPGSVVFILMGDGKKIWTSGVMKKGDKAKHIDADISGIDILNFTVDDANDGISGDVANWANVYVTTSSGFVPQLVNENYNVKHNFNVIAKPLASALLKLPNYVAEVAKTDWLVQKPTEKAKIQRIGNNEIILSNGLVSRTFYLSANLATTSIKNLVADEEYLRAVEPEANVMIDSVSYPVGGLIGQVDKGYLLNRWLKNMYPLPNAFVLTSFEITELKPHLTPSIKRWKSNTQWLATGKELVFNYGHPVLKDVNVRVHYQLFDGLPLMCKWLEVTNKGTRKITVNHFESEIIAYHEPYNSTIGNGEWPKPNFHIENDYAFGGEFTYESSDQSIFWQTDKTYTSQADYNLNTPCIVKSMPKIGPKQQLAQNETFTTFSTYLLALDGMDRERNGLSQRKMYRALAPWSTENPIFLHLTTTDPVKVKNAIDQCKETGYEMIILSFGSGLNMENTSPENLKKFKELADYAHAKGIEIGGYSLFSSRTIDAENDVINVNTGKPGGTRFNNAPCLGSKWGIEYLKKLSLFFDATGFDILEHDGPYPGDFCASTTHPGHKGYGDSQWNQWKQTVSFYESLGSKGIYMNVPDFYFLSGSNKVSVGYKEVNWSLPREQQLILGRQNNYDGTWTRTPSMCWTFVPLVEYHGGGAEATIEPLSEHLDTYRAHMVQNYGAGIQACYRGNRLYDTDVTRDMVASQINHYKKYRDILNADIIHLKRPTGRDWDGLLHVDPQLKEKAFALLFNPLDRPITTTIKLPLYYAGIKNRANINIEGKQVKTVEVDKNGIAEIEVTIPANGNTWMVIE
jgi:hypothetical protein